LYHLFNNLFCLDWIVSDSVKFIICGGRLYNFDLCLESVLDNIFELSLNLLGLPEYIPELGSECLVYSLLYSRLRLISKLHDRVLNICLHPPKKFLDHFLISRVSCHCIVDLFDSFCINDVIVDILYLLDPGLHDLWPSCR